jgi:CIC family chloride channel protein
LPKLADLYRNLSGVSRFGNWLLYGALIGIIAGLGAILFTFGIDLCTELLYTKLAGYQVPSPGSGALSFTREPASVHHWLFFFIPAVGGLVVGWLVYQFAPEAEGHGTDEVVRAFHQQRGIIRRRVPFIKTIASIITIGSGGSAGREGPVALIGAGFGSFLAQVLKLPDKERRLMVVAGMGGGIGSIFRAPLGGAIFATEVMYREPDFEYEGLIPAIISAIVAYSVYGVVYGWGSIFHTPNLFYHEPKQLVLYLILGIVAAGIGLLYLRVFYDLRNKVFRKLRIKKHFIPAIGGLLLGVLAYWFPPVLGAGYGWIQLAIYGKLALATMLLFPLLKIVATSLTIGSGGSGGVFAPSLVIGGMLGGAFGEVCRTLLPSWNLQPAAFIMVGMAGFFAGIAKVPISALILVSEMTGSYGLLVPTMLVAAVALLLTGRHTIYEAQVPHRAQSPAHRGEFLTGILDAMKVREFMVGVDRQQMVPENMILSDLLKIVSRTDHEYFLTVDHDRRVTGFIALDDLRRVMLEPQLRGVLIAKDLAVPNYPRVNEEDTLTAALSLFTRHSVDEIPVVKKDTGRTTGLIRRKDLVTAYNRVLFEKKEERKSS